MLDTRKQEVLPPTKCTINTFPKSTDTEKIESGMVKANRTNAARSTERQKKTFLTKRTQIEPKLNLN